MRIEMLTRGIWNGGRNAQSIRKLSMTRSSGVVTNDPAFVAGHPLQAGFLTSAAGKGASIFKMMGVSRHKSVDTLRGHVRDASYSRIMPGLDCPDRGCAPHICSGVFCGPGLCTGILLGPDLCARILQRMD